MILTLKKENDDFINGEKKNKLRKDKKDGCKHETAKGLLEIFYIVNHFD